MAFSASKAAANYVHSDYTGLEGVYSVRRKYDLSDKIVSLDRAIAVFDYRLRQAGKKFSVSDPEPKVLLDQERPLKFTLYADGADGTYEGNLVYMDDAQAKWLQSGDVVMCPQIFCDSDGAAYSASKYGQVAPETMIVQSVDLSGYAAGYAKISVTRGNGYNRSAAAAGVVTTIASEYVLIWQGNSLPAGGNAPNPREHELDSDQNYTQFFSETTGEDEQYTNTNIYGKRSFNERFAITREALNRKIESALLFGRKGKRLIGGKEAWLTGGIVEFVADANTAIDGLTRRHDYAGTFSVHQFRKFMEIDMRYGNKRFTKWGFTGGKFFTELESYLEKFLVFNDKLSASIKLPVFTIETGHGTVELMRHSLLTEMSTSSVEWSLDMILVDPDFVDIMYLQNMDIKTRMDIQNPRSHVREAEVYGQIGLKRTHPTAHAIHYGLQEAA
jgi:hypothetical protein